jgi:hypothetical protein
MFSHSMVVAAATPKEVKPLAAMMDAALSRVVSAIEASSEAERGRMRDSGWPQTVAADQAT